MLSKRIRPKFIILYCWRDLNQEERERNWLSGLTSLKYLNISCERLLSQVSVRVLQNLESLHLNWSLLKSFESVNINTKTSLANLKILNLAKSKLDMERADVFAGLVQLAQLNLRSNAIKKIHENSFRGLDNLERLDLSSNMLENPIIRVFSHLKKLKHLNLSNNLLSGYTRTADWTLRSTRLTCFESLSRRIPPEYVWLFAASGLEQLEFMNLQKNRFTRIDSRTFKGLRNLKTLILDDNLIQVIAPNSFLFSSCLEHVSLNRNF